MFTIAGGIVLALLFIANLELIIPVALGLGALGAIGYVLLWIIVVLFK